MNIYEQAAVQFQAVSLAHNFTRKEQVLQDYIDVQLSGQFCLFF